MKMTANLHAGRPFPRMVAACLLAAAAVPATACGASDQTTDTTFRDTVLRHQRLIADCMKDRGFGYNAGLPKSVLAEEARRQAEAEGKDGQAATDRALAGVADPNERLLAGLSPAQQAHWGDALWGDPARVGCHDLTYEAAWGISLGDLAAKGEAFLTKVEADPRVMAARGEYSRCMAARDHAVSRPDDVETTIAREAAGLDDQAAEAYGAAVLRDHKTCVAAYDKILAETYDRLSR